MDVPGGVKGPMPAPATCMQVAGAVSTSCGREARAPIHATLKWCLPGWLFECELAERQAANLWASHRVTAQPACFSLLL